VTDFCGDAPVGGARFTERSLSNVIDGAETTMFPGDGRAIG
jgi:hypothetical protein